MANGTVHTNLPDIQGNIVGGFNKDHQTFLFLRFGHADKARAWIKGLIPHIATAEEVLTFNKLFKLLKRRHGGQELLEVTWVNIAFSFAGLEALNVPSSELSLFPNDFKEGMAARAGHVGDIGDNAPSHWIEPLQGGGHVHAVVLVAGDDLDDLAEQVAALRASLDGSGIEVAYQQDGNARVDQPGHEHFGYDDGVSQPGLRDDRVTPPAPGDPDKGLPGQDRLWPGEFVLGYPQQAPGSATDQGPTAKSGPGWTVDGSYLVFRRLRQDVKGFNDFVAAESAAHGESPELFGAKVVGRYKTGCPLELTDDEPSTLDTQAADPSLADATLLTPEKINNFDFKLAAPLPDDSDGHVVPRGSHIRKVYPRNAEPPGEAVSEAKRVLRRGVAFGLSYVDGSPDSDPSGAHPAFPNDRGLLFLCYQQSISEKFEFLMHHWVNNANFPQPGDGVDLVIAQQATTRKLALPGVNPPSTQTTHQWVTTTFGEYFFQPSIRALTHLSG